MIQGLGSMGALGLSGNCANYRKIWLLTSCWERSFFVRSCSHPGMRKGQRQSPTSGWPGVRFWEAWRSLLTRPRDRECGGLGNSTHFARHSRILEGTPWPEGLREPSLAPSHYLKGRGTEVTGTVLQAVVPEQRGEKMQPGMKTFRPKHFKNFSIKGQSGLADLWPLGTFIPGQKSGM